MAESSTISHSIYQRCSHDIQKVIEPTAINEIDLTSYDSLGALFFIIIVLLWFSIGVVCMLGIHIRARSETIDDCARRRAKFLLQTLHDQTETKQILEELVDKDKRDKLWKIYFGKLDPSDDLKQAEQIRIKNIQKQLSTINRNQILLDETVRTPMTKSCLHRSSSHRTTYLSADNRQRDRRRSSLDLQIIEQWKSTVDRNPFQQQVPWPIKKVLLSRQFHQSYKRSSTDTQLNREHCAPLIEIEKDHLSTRTSRESSSNPYVTYFHLPLVTMRPSHQVIQIDDNDNQMLNFSKV